MIVTSARRDTHTPPPVRTHEGAGVRDRKIWEPSVGARETHEEGSGQGSGKDTLEKLIQKTAS